MRAFVILFSIFIIFPLSTFAQPNLDELLAPIDFLEESDEERPKDQQYILKIKQLETQQGVTASSLTAQELSVFNERGYVIRRMDDEADKPASLHFSLDTTHKSFDLVPGTREDISPTTMQVTTSDSSGYQLIAKLKNELKTASGQKIPPTTCDDECTTRIAGLWTREDAYGWGYTLDGTTYRSLSLDEYIVLKPTKLGLTVFPSMNQPLGAYGATIQVVALPW